MFRCLLKNQITFAIRFSRVRGPIPLRTINKQLFQKSANRPPPSTLISACGRHNPVAKYQSVRCSINAEPSHEKVNRDWHRILGRFLGRRRASVIRSNVLLGGRCDILRQWGIRLANGRHNVLERRGNFKSRRRHHLLERWPNGHIGRRHDIL